MRRNAKSVCGNLWKYLNPGKVFTSNRVTKIKQTNYSEFKTFSNFLIIFERSNVQLVFMEN